MINLKYPIMAELVKLYKIISRRVEEEIEQKGEV